MAPNPESRRELGAWYWIPDRCFAASGMTAEFSAMAKVRVLTSLPTTHDRTKLPFADLLQNLSGVLAEPRRRMLRGHRRTIHHDRRADAGNASALGKGARNIEQHAAMLDVRIREHLVEVVDRAGRHADRLELVGEILHLELQGQRG